MGQSTLSAPDGRTPLALILGIQRPTLSADELAFFRAANPYGLFLGRRNMKDQKQTRALCDAFREAVGRPNAPVFCDQEGGRVSHLDSGAWPLFRSFAEFGRLARKDRAAARRAIRLSTLAMGRVLQDAGLYSGCSPVLDLALAGADPVIGPRAFSDDPEIVAELGREVVEAFLAVGIMPVMKHIPGHGRAREDSHKTRPVVDASAEELDRADFKPFHALKATPWAMVSHVVYSAFDREQPASVSPTVIDHVIRRRLAYDGVLVSDCIFMNSLQGAVHERVAQVLDAGCDIALHCHGELPEMERAAKCARPLSDPAKARIEAADRRLGSQEPDVRALHAEVEALLAAA
jgi:beta-N-acetylhexosaminidase